MTTKFSLWFSTNYIMLLSTSPHNPFPSPRSMTHQLPSVWYRDSCLLINVIVIRPQMNKRRNKCFIYVRYIGSDNDCIMFSVCDLSKEKRMKVKDCALTHNNDCCICCTRQMCNFFTTRRKTYKSIIKQKHPKSANFHHWVWNSPVSRVNIPASCFLCPYREKFMNIHPPVTP